MAYRTLRGGVAGLGSPYSNLSGLGNVRLRLRRPDLAVPTPVLRQIRGTAAARLTARGDARLPRQSAQPAQVSGIGAWLGSVPAVPPAAVGGPPPEATVITAGLAVDITRGDIWVGPTKVPILPAVLSAIVVKVIMFGGAYAGDKARSLVRRKPATA